MKAGHITDKFWSLEMYGDVGAVVSIGGRRCIKMHILLVNRSDNNNGYSSRRNTTRDYSSRNGNKSRNRRNYDSGKNK